MRKLLLFFVAWLVFSTTVFAESTFFSGNQNDTAQSSGGFVKVQSPNDFKKSVNAVDQKTKQEVREQLNQQLSNKPAIPIQQTSPPPQPEPQSSSTSLTRPTALPAPGVIPPTPSTPALPPAPVTARPTAPPPPPAAPAGSTSITNTPAQSQVYTGFQGQSPQGGSSNQRTTPPAQSGGGWNIKY